MKNNVAPMACPHDRAAILFSLLVEQVRDYAIYALDVDGHVVSWNNGAALLKGYTEDEILGSHFERFFTDEDRLADKPRNLLEQAKKEGRMADEGWRVKKDGSRFWASVVITALVDHDGAFQGYGKVTRDLTERKKVEEDLRQAVRRLQERNEELEVLADAVVGRELKMMQLEKDVARLQAERNSDQYGKWPRNCLSNGR